MSFKVRPASVDEIIKADLDWEAMRKNCNLDSKWLWKAQYRVAVVSLTRPGSYKERN